MNQRDVTKLNAVGFRVFKYDVTKRAIYENTAHGSWKLHEKFTVKAAADYQWKMLMASPKCIAG